jgi:beta-lactamase regulating signal transducer with metallopeptidase domain
LLVVLLKLLTPPVIAWPWSLPEVMGRRLAETRPRAEAKTEPDTTPTFAMIDLSDGEQLPAGEWVLSTEKLQEPAAEAARAGWIEGWKSPIAFLAAAAWVASGVSLAALELARARRLRGLLQHARPVPAGLTAAVHELAEHLGVRPPRVLVVPALASPVVWVWGRARLLWPEGLEEGLSPEALRAVLVHELAHLRRRDHWVGWLVLAAGCVWWWHPLFWWVRRRLSCEAELACDAWVVATLPGARRAYAEALLTVCQRWSLPAAAAPALGAAGQRRDLERRLIMVMREQVPYRLSLTVMLGVGALALVALPALTSGQSTPTTPAVQPVPAPTQATVSFTTGSADSSDGEARIKELEEKVELLLKELRALRGERRTSTSTTRSAAAAGAKPVTVAPFVITQAPYQVPLTATVTVDRVKPAEAGGPVSEVSLTRATYKLKGTQAESLGKFLSDNVKASVLETKVDGENLIVTTTPEVQQVVTQVIALMQGKPLPKTFWYQTRPATR